MSVTSKQLPEEILADSYLLASVLFISPSQMDEESTNTRIINLCESLKEAGRSDIAEHFEMFHQKLWSISEEDHLFTLEMTPTAPPYLGYYGFDAPKSCGEIGTSERNMYMIEIAGVYKHYGIKMEHGEMPDYFPAVCEFLAISLAETDPKSRNLRRGFINSMVKPHLPKFSHKLNKKPWSHITAAVAGLMESENIVKTNEGDE